MRVSRLSRQFRIDFRIKHWVVMFKHSHFISQRLWLTLVCDLKLFSLIETFIEILEAILS